MINKKHISLLTLAIFLSLSHFAVSASAQPSVVEVPSVSVQPSVDSLSHYLEQAARSNPQVNADFMLYKASLEKIPQAGAFADPELEIGFFVKPMETLMGKQIADFTLMQMFPWFGTRKAARSEASEMARMAYEQFRDTRNNLWYEVKAQWYQLSSLNEQYHIAEANIRLLYQLEQLALNRFSASSAQAAPSSTSVTSVASMPSALSSGSGMSGMGGMGSPAPAGTPGVSAGSSSGRGMSGMGGGSMGNVAVGGMSDVLRIQMERAGLEDNLASLLSARLTVQARFNALLNRPSDASVCVPDSLTQRFYRIDGQLLLDSIFTRNPMLAMLEAEGEAYRAKAKMDRRMSYPMIGIGLQYSVVNKVADPMGMPDMNGKDMVMPMVKVSLPLFRRKYNARQRESHNYRMASELKRDNVQNQLQAEYINVCQQLDDAARKVSLYERQYALSLSTWQLMVREFTAGRQSLTDVIQVERQMLDYKLKKSEAVAAYNTTVAAIEKLIAD